MAEIPEPAPHSLLVRSGEFSRAVSPGDEVTFGRSADCSLCLDPDDVVISRLAGRLRHDVELWWVENASASRPLAVVDDFGLRSVLPPGRRRSIEGPLRVLVDGTERTFEIAAVPTTPAAKPGGATVDPADGVPTTLGEHVVINDADRAALLALFAGYLEQGTRYDPNPKSYAAAAARLGWPRTTLVKRIEYLRSRLSASGVPNLVGPFALNNLAEYVLTTGLITREDLERIRQ